MSRSTRNNHQTTPEPDQFDGLFDVDDLQSEDQEFLAEQALLEAIERPRTPSLPSTGTRSRRSSARAPTYEPEHPSVHGNSTPYDPSNWEAISLASNERRRSSTPVNRRSRGRHSPRTPLYSPSHRSQRFSHEYDPRTPLFPIAGLQYPPIPPNAELYDPTRRHYHSVSVALGGERSPGHTDYEDEYDDDESAQDNTIRQQIHNTVQQALQEALPRLQNELERWMAERLRGLARDTLESIASGSGSRPVSPSALKPSSRKSSSASRSDSRRASLKRVTFESDGDGSGDTSPPPRKKARKTTSSRSPSPTTLVSQVIPERPQTPSALHKAARSPPAKSNKSKKQTSPSLPSSQNGSEASRSPKPNLGKNSSNTNARQAGNRTPSPQIESGTPRTPAAPRKSAAARTKPSAVTESEAPRRSARVKARQGGSDVNEINGICR